MIITPNALCGEIAAIPSKSDAHRAIICALLSRSKCEIAPIIRSKDIVATIKAAGAFGAKCEIVGNKLIIDSSELKTDKHITVDCCESGSTLRFMLAVTAALGVTTDFVGSGRLPLRPIDEFYSLFSEHGATMSQNHLPLSLSGRLTGGEYKISGNVSSQYLTGLLLALPTLDGDSTITLTTELESRPYIDMTIRTLSEFGVKIEQKGNKFTVRGNQQYKCDKYEIDGDWSQAAFFLAGGAIGGKITMSGLRADSTQGDKRIFDIIKDFGGNIRFDGKNVISEKSKLHATEIDATQIPDLVPIVAVLAANAEGESRIYGAKRLRYKESDRIVTTAAALRSFGADVTEKDDGLIITGGKYHGGNVDCCNDHRIAMAFSVMATAADSDTKMVGTDCVSKSYPEYFDDFTALQKGLKK